MKKYKVKYVGYAYVKAENEPDAIEGFWDGLEVYDEREVVDVSEVDEFLVDFDEEE